MHQFPNLFSEGRIGRMTIKNRLMMAPMVRNYADEQGRITEKYRAHISSIAQGGVGALILEASYVTQDGKGFANQLGIHTDETMSGLRNLAEIAHRHGAVIGPQLYHAGRQTSSAVTGMPIVAPSAIPDPTINEVPLELTVDEIHRIVDAFAQAARRAKEAGCDFVEIHGAHGYLITQFLSPYSNVRTDAYGGSDEGRMRFLVEVVEAIRGQVGPDFPVTVRLSGIEFVPGGLTIDDTVHIARILESLRVDGLHITAGNYASYTQGYMIQPMAIPDAPLVHLAQRVKEAVRLPVIAVGKIRSPELAEQVISGNMADFVALGRVLLADPAWPNKAMEMRTSEINKCIACNQGCISRLFLNQDVWCTVNPITAREEQFFTPPPTAKKRIMVIGGGPAGMEAAIIAAERGHTVTLFEEDQQPGGQLLAAAAAPYRPGWRELHQYQMRELARLQIDVRTKTKCTADMVQQENPDAVVVAVGASPVRLKIPGLEGENVITAFDLLVGNAEAKGRVVVAGGGCSGAQTAEFLAEKGHEVTIVEMLDDIAVDAPLADRELLLDRLNRYGVKMLMHTKIMRVERDHVAVERPGGFDDIPADTVVICLGSRSNDGITEELRKMGYQVFVVGDAVQPRKVTEAIEEGARAILGIEGQHQQMAEAA